ncbi:MAG: type II toxin-antitoxin system RelE/ParE family toxin [Solirubrobacterales bacterium]
MDWEVEFTDEFEEWWDGLTPAQQEALNQRVQLLAASGPNLKRPTVGAIKGSQHDPQMKELICDAEGAAMRVLFVFDPRRTAILLIGGDKSGEWDRWYKRLVPEADKLYDHHLEELRKEGVIKDG